MSNTDLLKTLERCASISREKRIAFETERAEELNKPAKNKKISASVIEDVKDKIILNEQLGLFTSLDITKTKSFPTLLGRLPIFLPGPSKRQAKMIDQDYALSFDTPFGRGRRFGPPVTIPDESVLFALLHLSEKRLIGHSNHLPIPLENNKEWLTNKSGELTVQIATVTIAQIICEIGMKSLGGKNYKSVLASIKRINQISIEIETKKQDMYMGTSWAGGSFRLVDIQWKTFEEQGLIYAQFTPIMVKWLKENATYYSLEIRHKLKTDNAKALHRFLSTQGNKYSADLKYIADVIEWYGSYSRLRPQITSILNQLKDKFKWCDFEITGNGRKTPYHLKFWRTK